MEKLKLKKATTIASLGSNQRKIVNYINDNISEGSNNSGTTTPPSTPGLPNESVSTDNLLVSMDLGKCSISSSLLGNSSGFQFYTGPLNKNIKFEKDGEDITDMVCNLKDGCYMWMFDNIQLQLMEEILSYEEWLISIKTLLQSQNLSIRRFLEINNIEYDQSDTDDDLYRNVYDQYLVLFSEGFIQIRATFNILANMSSSYFVRVRRKNRSSFIDAVKEQLALIYGEEYVSFITNMDYDSVLEWNIASSSTYGANMSFIEFTKNNTPIHSIWIIPDISLQAFG